MNKFAKYYFTPLLEGGNVKIMGGNVEGADKIRIDQMSEDKANELKSDITQMLIAFNNKYGGLWSNLESLIKSGDLFSGSTRLFFTKPHKEFIQHKKIVGDIDLQYPTEEKDKLVKFLEDQTGTEFGNLTLVGRGGRSPIQYNTLFKTKDGKNIQVDFEPTYWEDGKPSEFSKFAHYSSWKDIQSNIKGAFVKLLLRALIGREKLGNIAVITKTGKISKSAKFENPGLRGFSVDKGVRIKFDPILDDKGEIEKTEDGRPKYRETDTKTVEYERDIGKIFQLAFGETPTAEEKKDFHSFVGVVNILKKYLPEEVKAVFDKFMEIIWGDLAQEIETGNLFNKYGIQVNDFLVKKAAFDQFVKVFPNLKMNDNELRKYVKPFYDKLSLKYS